MKTNIGPLLNDKKETVSDPFAMANMLAEQYAKMFSKPLNVTSTGNDDETALIPDLLFDMFDWRSIATLSADSGKRHSYLSKSYFLICFYLELFTSYAWILKG